MKAFLICVLMLVLLVSPSSSSQASVQALRIWGLDVAPSLFPYMVLCQSLTVELNRFPLFSAFLSPVLGLLGGSPAGSAALAASSRIAALSFRRILCLITLSGTISPMFFLGPVSSWLNSAAAGRKLLFSHIAGAALSCIVVLLFYPPSVKHSHSADQVQANLESPILRSVHAVLNVGGCIIFYSVMANSANLLLPFAGENLQACFHAVLEVSGGLKALIQCSMPHNTRMILCAACTGFSGFSILTQNLVFLHPLGIKMKHLAAAGLLRAIISGLIMQMLLS